MILSNKVKYAVLSIRDMDEVKQMHKRTTWLQYSKARQDYLDKLRVDKVKGKEYSDAVVAWDRQYVGKNLFYNT